jgi:hypothetical protein
MEGAFALAPSKEVRRMGSTAVLSETVHRRHDHLADQLEVLRTLFRSEDEEESHRSRRGCPPIDEFVTAASRHLHAVNEVLLPPVRHELPHGKQVAHHYLEAAHGLEVVLAHVKAHEYGSVYEGSFSWTEALTEAGAALDTYRECEEEMAEQLTGRLDDAELDELAERLVNIEPREPTRPHPYLPHAGPLGAVARGVVRVTDRAWDHAEGRPLPPPKRPPRKRPGLLGQYLLANPQFDPEAEEPEAP